MCPGKATAISIIDLWDLAHSLCSSWCVYIGGSALPCRLSCPSREPALCALLSISCLQQKLRILLGIGAIWWGPGSPVIPTVCYPPLYLGKLNAIGILSRFWCLNKSLYVSVPWLHYFSDPPTVFGQTDHSDAPEQVHQVHGVGSLHTLQLRLQCQRGLPPTPALQKCLAGGDQVSLCFPA